MILRRPPGAAKLAPRRSRHSSTRVCRRQRPGNKAARAHTGSNLELRDFKAARLGGSGRGATMLRLQEPERGPLTSRWGAQRLCARAPPPPPPSGALARLARPSDRLTCGALRHSWAAARQAHASWRWHAGAKTPGAPCVANTTTGAHRTSSSSPTRRYANAYETFTATRLTNQPI